MIKVNTAESKAKKYRLENKWCMSVMGWFINFGFLDCWHKNSELF
jgi:hypothetical protein